MDIVPSENSPSEFQAWGYLTKTWQRGATDGLNLATSFTYHSQMIDFL